MYIYIYMYTHTQVRRTHGPSHLHGQLMGARDEHEAVVVVELLANVHAKRVPRAARRDSPAAPVVWIRPQQVAHRALVRDLLPRQLLHLRGRGARVPSCVSESRAAAFTRYSFTSGCCARINYRFIPPPAHLHYPP